MPRYITRLLIFTLLLTAPLSYAGDVCPDFKPVSELREQCEERAAVAVAPKQSTVPPSAPVSLSAGRRCISFPPPAASASSLDALKLTLHDRAPPA